LVALIFRLFNRFHIRETLSRALGACFIGGLITNAFQGVRIDHAGWRSRAPGGS
jgi:hypothetical protein